MITCSQVGERPGMMGRFKEQRWLALLGIVLLGFGAWWWSQSLRLNRLKAAQRTWVPAVSFLGLDFLNNYYAARFWLAGGNPYQEPFGDPLGRPFIYAPVNLALFSWCSLFEAHMAVHVWLGALVAMAGLGAVVCWRTRQQLGLALVPLPFVLAAVLCSHPIWFALERGNSDLLVLVLIVLAAVALRGRTLLLDILVGMCVALAGWIKIYPLLLVSGLCALRRPRAVLCAGLAYAAIGLVDFPGTLQHIESERTYVATYDIACVPSAHPLTTYWFHLWINAGVRRLARIPGIVGASCTLLPLVFWVSHSLFRCPRRERLMYAYLCWLVAVATFFPPVSNDYNLFFLPLAALAVWDRRDPVLVHLLMAPLLFWWQPVRLPIGANLLFIFKLAGLASVGMCLVNRAREQALAPANDGAPEHGSGSRPQAAAA